MNKTKAKKSIKVAAKPIIKKTKTIKKTSNKTIAVKKPQIKKTIKTKEKKKVQNISNKEKIIKKPILISDDEEISENDTNLLEESFSLIKNLNTQVGEVQNAKQALEKDIKLLSTRLSKHEETTKSGFNNKFLLTVKEEMIKEFTPILNKLDYKSLKVDMFKEIEKIIEIEVHKTKTEFESKTRKTSNEYSKKVSELEIRLVDALKSNENIKKELKKFEKKEVSMILNEFETKVHISLENTSKRALAIFNATSKELEIFKQELTNQKKTSDELAKNILMFKKQIEGLVSKDGVDLTSVESKISKLEKELSSYKMLIEKYENELYNRKKDENSQIESKVRKTLENAENTLNEIKTEKNNTEKQLTEKIEIMKNNLLKSIDNNYKELNEKNEKRLSSSISEFNSEKSTLEKDLELFKFEISTLIKNYISELDKELKTIKTISSEFKTENRDYSKEMKIHISNYSKDFESKLDALKKEIKTSFTNTQNSEKKEKESISQKSKELLKTYDNTIKNIEEENKILRKALEVELKFTLDDQVKNTKEEISKQIISLNNTLTQITSENKEDKRNFSEDIESKFILSKEQYETQFRTHMESFETELKSKENEFLQKLQIIEDDKNLMLKELESFKVDLSSLTKNYVTKLDEELKYLKSAEANFEERKEDFLRHIDEIINVKKVEIEDYSEILKNDLQNQLNKQNELFETHENTFRDVFNEKITTLSENTKKRLDLLDKKFLEKNIKIIDEKIKESQNSFSVIEEKLNSKTAEIEKRLESIDKKEEDFYSQLDSEIKNFNEKSEERLMGLEKQFNKRFLEYDSNFSNFKGIIVDEVEDLIKEVNSIMETKLENLDKTIAKLNFVSNDAINKLNDLRKVQETVENEIRDVRDDVNDLRVKFEITVPENHNLNDHIRYMSEYETQLIALIKSLKDKGISDSSIKIALINKGHPRFYISMILDNYKEIINFN